MSPRMRGVGLLMIAQNLPALWVDERLMPSCNFEKRFFRQRASRIACRGDRHSIGISGL